MKVFYDHQIFTTQKTGGISRYFKYLLDGLNATDGCEAKLGVLRSDNIYLEETDVQKDLLRPRFLLNSYRKVQKYNKSFSENILKKSSFDILHPTYYNPYYLEYNCKPTVLTVHDMTYEALPHLFPIDDPTPYFKRLTMERADRLIAISEATKQDILRYTKISESKIDVIHHGIDLTPPIYEEVLDLPEEYILFVGGRWSYKNFFLLVDAFKILSINHPKLNLVLAGGGNLQYGDSEYALRNGISAKVKHYNPTDAQLNTLYKNAKCFVYSSSYEGFGFPILEAFKNNCPVILNNIACFKEIASNAALYFEDENSPESLITQIQNIIENENLRKELITKGLNQLSNYSIAECVDKTINIYKALI